VIPVRSLRDAFTPYEIAIGGLLITWFCLGSGLVVAFVLDRPRGLGVMVLAGALVSTVAWFAALCPGCRKSPTQRYLTDRGARRRGWPMGHRLWPERTCSLCGADLDAH
jgi:hypothetical protein